VITFVQQLVDTPNDAWFQPIHYCKPSGSWSIYFSKFRRLTYCGNNAANKVVDLTLYSKRWVEAKHKHLKLVIWNAELYIFSYVGKKVFTITTYLYPHTGTIKMITAMETHLIAFLSSKVDQFPYQILRHHSLWTLYT